MNNLITTQEMPDYLESLVNPEHVNVDSHGNTIYIVYLDEKDADFLGLSLQHAMRVVGVAFVPGDCAFKMVLNYPGKIEKGKITIKEYIVGMGEAKQLKEECDWVLNVTIKEKVETLH